MKIGNKIRKIRELKSITPKDMADRLNITPQSYNKIEREEVDINIERLLEIAGVFEMKPEDVISFDEKLIFQNHGEMKDSSIGIFSGNQYNFPQELKDLYESKIKLLEDKINYQNGDTSVSPVFILY
jgi:transcriptional regulator with XRE-family HTH domain